jgi:hypothetical protein
MNPGTDDPSDRHPDTWSETPAASTQRWHQEAAKRDAAYLAQGPVDMTEESGTDRGPAVYEIVDVDGAVGIALPADLSDADQAQAIREVEAAHSGDSADPDPMFPVTVLRDVTRPVTTVVKRAGEHQVLAPAALDSAVGQQLPVHLRGPDGEVDKLGMGTVVAAQVAGDGRAVMFTVELDPATVDRCPGFGWWRDPAGPLDLALDRLVRDAHPADSIDPDPVRPWDDTVADDGDVE